MALQTDALSHIHLHAQYLHSYAFVQSKNSLNTMLIFLLLLLEILTTFTDSNSVFKPVWKLTFNVSVHSDFPGAS